MTEAILLDSRSLLRATLYDAGFRYPERVISDFGIPTVSEEGAEFERKASHTRRHALDGIAPLLAAQSAWIATACVYEHLDYQPRKEDPEHLKMGVAFHGLITCGVIGVLSSLVDAGIIVPVVTHIEPSDFITDWGAHE